MHKFPTLEKNNTDSCEITVILPAFNAAKFLADTLRSVLAQDYPGFELLVIDDGSTDGTAAIAAGFAAQDDRVRVISQDNGGVAAARNRGIAEARGQYLAFIDADDLWESETLGLWHHTLDQVPDSVGVVYAWSLDVDDQNLLTGGFHAAEVVGPVLPTLLAHNFLGNASATMVRRSFVQAVGGYDSSLRDRSAQGCEDWDFYFKLSEICEFAVVPRFLVRYRKPAVSMSSDYDQMARSHALVLDVLRNRVPSLPGWLYGLSKSSLYLHFANLSAQSGNASIARQWCQRAWQCDRVTPLLRPGWYRLRFGRSVSPAKRIESNHQMPSKRSVFLKVFVSGLLHQGLRFWAIEIASTQTKSAVATKKAS
jgi:glycosyltransferase involved in cell wall biosynthesis